MNAVIYARFSSHSQTEQSIEGQLKVCYDYAQANNIQVIGEYIDRAQTGTNDNRTAFQKMISDSDTHSFDTVLVYQLDRFARNRYDSATYKAKLKRNGVRVVSAKENISDDPSGILVEGVLESMAEYYSAELSQKIRRGMEINAQKCKSNGSNPGLGFKVDANRDFYVDPDEAKIVRETFERYAAGETVADIVRNYNERHLKTSKGKDFNKNSLHRMLQNKRYIGTYLYRDIEIPGGMPRIIDDDLFERVQFLLEKNKKASARTRGNDEYLLTTKLFCGHCLEMMTGYSGTGKSGKKYCYYACKNSKKKKCVKRIESKDSLEDMIVGDCKELLTDENIEIISKSVSDACKKEADIPAVKMLEKQIRDIENAIENLWSALERGESSDMVTERIEKRKKEKTELEAQLATEKKKQVTYTYPQIYGFMKKLQASDFTDIQDRRSVINIFLRAVYLKDDEYTLLFNTGTRPMRVTKELRKEITEKFTDDSVCSSTSSVVPPHSPCSNRRRFGRGAFFIYHVIKDNRLTVADLDSGDEGSVARSFITIDF